ncbi:hypothetical protein [Rudaea sp.]|uniref:hypothetical protein n=1 Tax=Rudaea sp. TaxID=2136325 RepID=UPI0025E90013|nr:hypothetical protein [Rudaea sp.]
MGSIDLRSTPSRRTDISICHLKQINAQYDLRRQTDSPRYKQRVSTETPAKSGSLCKVFAAGSTITSFDPNEAPLQTPASDPELGSYDSRADDLEVPYSSLRHAPGVRP